MASVSRDYIVSALRSGFTDTQIAQALGVSPSAVAQLVDAHNLRDIANRNSRFSTIDDKLNSIEETALTNLEKQVKYMSDPMKLLKVVTGVNNAKRRSLAEGSTVVNNNNTQLVQINLPNHLRADIKLNAQNQVVAIEDRELVTMQSGKLLKNVEAGKELPALPKLRNPAGSTAGSTVDEVIAHGGCAADYL